MPDNGGATTEYVVVSGDTLGKIAHAHGVTVKALEAANPGVDPKKLHVKQKLNIPAPSGTRRWRPLPMLNSGSSTDSGESYVVKSGDNLTKIARAHHVKVKALEAANGLSTTQIKVGEKLKIPAAEAVAAPVTPAPTTDMTAAAGWLRRPCPPRRPRLRRRPVTKWRPRPAGILHF